MDIVQIAVGAIICIVLMELIKHFFFKKTAKLVIMLIIIFILFLVFSYAFKNVESFQDNKLVQTGAVVADKLFGVLKEKADTDSFVNSTLKSNKLFKS